MSSKQAAPKRVGVIDVGSNTIKLLVAERGDSEPLSLLRFQVEHTRISEGIASNPPTLAPSAIAAAASSIHSLKRAAVELQCDVIHAVATSAARDAANQSEFVAAVKDVSGIQLRILSGEEEANLIGIGMRCDPALVDYQDFALIDLGGGSMEHISFLSDKAVSAKSYPLGCVRLTSQFVTARETEIPESEIAAIQAHTRDALFGAIPQSELAILTGGAATVIATTHRDLPELTLQQLQTFRDTICAATLSERIALHRIPHDRADILPAALATLCETLRTIGATRIRFSNYNLRCGVAREALANRF